MFVNSIQPADDSEAFERPTIGHLLRWVLLAAFATIVMLRLPLAWAEGRFQDEEATVFLAYAWHFPWQDALWRPFGGYLNLAANAATLLTVQLVRSGLLSLEHAPYLTMSIALACQLLPAALILTGKAPWLSSRLAVVAALAMVAVMPSTEEVFFNVLHIQYHLALCAALILAFDVPARRPARVGYGALLFIGPLCGPGAIVLLPLFALRGLLERDRARAWQLAALGAGAAAQLLLFYGASPVRGIPFDFAAMLAGLFVRLVALPTAGLGVANLTANALTDQAGGAILLWMCAMAAVLLLGSLFMFAAQRRDSGFWLALSGLLLAGVIFGVGFVSVDPDALFFATAGERYNFLPLVLLGLALIAMANREGFKGRRVCAALCALLLANGVIHYFRPVAQLTNGPSWPDQVRAWKADHRHPLAVWPKPWAADLSDENRRCSPPAPDVAKSTDPRYCENGWMAAFYRVNWR